MPNDGTDPTPTGSRPTVTVAVPVYNGEAHLAETLESVRRQTVAPTDLLVFDNCSTDGSRQIAGAVLPPGAVRVAPVNQGAVQNFNRAVRDSPGDLFAWLAADDRLAPGFIEKAVEALERRPGATACLTGIQFIDPQGHDLHRQSDVALSSPEPAVRLRAYLRRARWTEVFCLYRREALLRTPMFRDHYGADVLLVWWILLREPLVVVSEPLVEYRTYPTKSAEETAGGLNPAMREKQWRMWGLWRALWRDTAAGDLDRRTRWTARRELLACLATRYWVKQLVWDAYMLRHYIGRRLRRPAAST